MKNLLIFAMLFVSVKVSAQSEEAAYDAAQAQHIERTRPDGKVEKFDGDEWMIVKRGPKKPNKKVVPTPVPVPQIVEKTVTVEKTIFVEKKTYQKNRITLLAGEGPRTGQNVNSYGATMETSSRVGAVGGLEYQYSFTQHWSAALQVQTNPSCLIGVGYGW